MTDSTCCYISSIDLETTDYVLAVRELGIAPLSKEGIESIGRLEFVTASTEIVLMMPLGNSTSSLESLTTAHG